MKALSLGTNTAYPNRHITSNGISGKKWVQCDLTKDVWTDKLKPSDGFSRIEDALKSQESHSELLKNISAKELDRTTTKSVICSNIGITLLNKVPFYLSHCADHCDPKHRGA